ncbi:MAG: hypothetical protein M1839_001963 [Geoglossum umbratile]|nr:MAG: hypothetical protein M1839_001963 [Geoglossum umbratile]
MCLSFRSIYDDKNADEELKAGEYSGAEKHQLATIKRSFSRHTRFKTQFVERGEIQEKFAAIYYKQNKFNEVKKVLTEILRAREERPGQHWRSMHCLAKVFLSSEELGKAEALCMKAVEGKMGAFGEEHKLSLESVSLLAVIYGKRGEYALVRALQEKYPAIVGSGARLDAARAAEDGETVKWLQQHSFNITTSY